ncbi:hypothetical protein [Parasulfitobacter algicola]|uniref:Uncharacterized protein n=1 Tax=Parasulfitobacter algicola TaxID=2614809 RepID=A0ABX2IN29_9RHOB|nr:hypothetical protein [Sulfitobacter algicola]NSX53750.1 hypothetical protein [Sulfitobacter algicola]
MQKRISRTNCPSNPRPASLRRTGNSYASKIAGSRPAQSNLVAETHPANSLFQTWFDMKVKMMKKIAKTLICRKCKAKLTDPLIAITTNTEMEKLCRFAVGEPVTPRGRFLLLAEDAIIKHKKMQRETIAANEAWIHLSDLSEKVGLTPLTKRLSGCCDISGMDGPNRVCQCGQHVGTQFSDCYEYHAFQPDTKTTKWIETKISEKENDKTRNHR